jgi:hypothetical protein
MTTNETNVPASAPAAARLDAVRNGNGVNISALSRQFGYSRTTVRRRLKQGWTPDSLGAAAPIKIPKDVHDVATLSIHRVQAVDPIVVDLVQLRRDIQDWTKLHNEVDRLRTGREPYNPRMWFLAVAVAFFVLVAYSAAVPA